MRRLAFILFCTLPWSLAAADLVASGVDAKVAPSASTALQAAARFVDRSALPASTTLDSRGITLQIDSPLLPNRTLAPPAPAVADEATTDLPPPPSSLALALSGIAGLGAYQAGRSIRKLHISHLPEWYHADATQVGHVTPLQLEFDYSALPVCVFADPSDLGRGFSYRIPREHRSRFVSEAFIPVTAPRAPPTL